MEKNQGWMVGFADLEQDWSVFFLVLGVRERERERERAGCSWGFFEDFWVIFGYLSQW